MRRHDACVDGSQRSRKKETDSKGGCLLPAKFPKREETVIVIGSCQENLTGLFLLQQPEPMDQQEEQPVDHQLRSPMYS
jgi:hypothetical protein